MNDLKKKTFITIFSIFTLFLVIITVFTNVQNYTREYNNVKNNLLRVNNMNLDKLNRQDNRIIMDYEIYTVLFDNDKNILSIISHSNEESNTDINKITNNILSKNNKIGYKINNLYFTNYSYKLDNNSLVIINTNNVKERLSNTLITSIILFVVLELIVIGITKLITNWLIKPAEDSFKKQKEFIADASHELKTPVAVIMASADALENDNNKKWLNNIKNETERMNKLITNLLDLSKLESETNIVLEEENLSKIVEKNAVVFESIAYENNIYIDTNIENDILFKCNSIEINELLSILIDNAIKHSTKKSHININLSKEKNNIVLKVINKGEAIPDTECEKIFERFYRVDKSRNRSDGRYGLGLAIAKNIVEKHNGKIKAYSKDGYTTFEVILKK